MAGGGFSRAAHSTYLVDVGFSIFPPFMAYREDSLRECVYLCVFEPAGG